MRSEASGVLGRARAIAVVLAAILLAFGLATRPREAFTFQARPQLGELERLPPDATVAEATSSREIPAGGPAVAHRHGARPVSAEEAGPVPEARLYLVGKQAAEPTLGIDKSGAVFYAAAEVRPPGLFGPVVMRTTDQGQSWQDVSPRLPNGAYAHSQTLDPMLHVDERTGRVFTVDLYGNCSLISTTDDRGASWNTRPACGPTDHQHVFTGPPRGSVTVGYPNVAYYCAIDGGALAAYGTFTSCLKSLDGGSTWVRTGAPPYHDNPNAGPGISGVPGHCGGASGHGVADDRGVIYLPRGYCGQPYLAISRDEGLTWTRVQVATNGMPSDASLQEIRSGVAVDSAGNLYYTWPGRNRLPYLSISRDGGATWSAPMMIGPPGLKEATLTEIDVREPGHIAIAYIGSENAPGGTAPDGSGPEYSGSTWNGYITVATNALAEDPIFYTATVNPRSDPLVKGGCGIFRCAQQYDFIDVVIGPDGTPWASMVDGCPARGACTSVGLGVAGRLVGGPLAPT